MEKILDLTRIPKEVFFILELLKEDNERTIQKNQGVLCKDIDWDLFLEYAMHHRVFPLLHSKIKLLDESLVPNSVVHFLTEQYKRNTFRMLQLTAEMERISKVFVEEGINTIFLKGPVIAKALYGDISLRTSTDLDFLISIKHLDNATKLLIKEGYEQTEYIVSIFNEWTWREHHITFFHPIKGIKVEVHWRLHPGPGKETSFIDLWRRRRKSNLTKFPTFFLGTEDLFHYLVVHGARHGWFRLRWLIDVKKMCEQSVDFKLVYDIFKANDNVHVGGQAIILMSKLLDLKVTDEMQFLIKGNHSKKIVNQAIFFLERMENLHSAQIAEEINEYYMDYLYSLKTNKTKILYTLCRLHPNELDAQIFPLPKKLYLLYFLLHPILWALRKKKHKALS